MTDTSNTTPNPAEGTAEAAPPEDLARIVETLPKEIGALLISVGALGFVLPGVAGTPAIIAGGMIFWPKTFGPIEGWLGRKFPFVHRQSLGQIRRYLNDLEHRYPTVGPRSSPASPSKPPYSTEEPAP